MRKNYRPYNAQCLEWETFCNDQLTLLFDYQNASQRCKSFNPVFTDEPAEAPKQPQSQYTVVLAPPQPVLQRYYILSTPSSSAGVVSALPVVSEGSGSPGGEVRVLTAIDGGVPGTGPPGSVEELHSEEEEA